MNRTVRLLVVSFAVLSFATLLHAQIILDEKFDYPVGAGLAGMGGWQTWDLDPTADAVITDAFAFSETTSVAVAGQADVVRSFFGLTSGIVDVRARVYVPSSQTGAVWFIILNRYSPGALDNNWSVQLSLSAQSGLISDNGGSAGGAGPGTALPLVTDSWTEIRVEVDLDQNLHRIYYDGQLLRDWDVYSGGQIAVDTLNLYSDNSDQSYFDDVAVDFARPPCPSAEDTTWGVNYDVATVSAGAISNAEMTFSAVADFQGTDLILASSTCGSGCRLALAPFAGPGGPDLEFGVFVSRFAKGGVSSVTGIDATWLVQMAECDGLSGSLIVPDDGTGAPAYPGTLTLAGRMILTAQVPGSDVVRLRSDADPIFEGQVDSWPPYGTVLELVNPPIDYYYEDDLGSPTASPVLTITSNTVTLGTVPSAFLSTAPEVLGVEIVDPLGLPWVSGPIGGTMVSWTDTSATPGLQCSVDDYHVYRNDQPGNLDAWRFIAQVPAAQTSYFDSYFDGGTAVEYTVVHVTELPFGHHYEGGLGQPFPVAIPGGTTFRRGDCNNDVGFNIADAITALSYLFASASVTCLDACDANDDGGVDISDGIFMLSALFVAGAPLPSTPHPDCGVDPTSDFLECARASCP